MHKYLIILSFPSIIIIQKQNVRAWSGEQSYHRGPKSSCRNQGSERCWSRFLINRLKGGKWTVKFTCGRWKDSWSGYVKWVLHPEREAVLPFGEQCLSTLYHHSGVVRIRHHSYSPDLSPVDHFLFPKVKITLRRRRFQNIEKSVTTTWDAISVGAFSDCFMHLWETCVLQSRKVLRRQTKQFSSYFMCLSLYRLSPELYCVTSCMLRICVIGAPEDWLHSAAVVRLCWLPSFDGCGCNCWHHTLAVKLTLILRRSRTGTVWFYTSTSNKRAARPKLHTKSLTRDLKLMYSGLTLVRISINL